MFRAVMSFLKGLTTASRYGSMITFVRAVFTEASGDDSEGGVG